MSRKGPKATPSWMVVIFDADMAIPNGGTVAMIGSPNKDEALARAHRLFWQYESWRVSVKRWKEKS